ncbi:RNA polymerase sigma factor RpoE [Stieleria neptunia]|uniref:RNA polymerase sigma factor RpoE n=1 Tax=Stieleria neptunia TaxID=2527979 RepID=A0A518HSS5_9BACT|nr:sigma-70 family RNA polymerase sigma factor [Stieleria neptunia]QDV43851.1 RNA polymerase sigma factor RpoE [Stieleria neptunia]
MESTSATLLGRLRDASDHQAWQEFVQIYTPMIHRWATALQLSQSDANDLTQDVMLTLVRRMHGFRYDPKKSFRSWLKTVAVNRGRDFLRKRCRSDVQLAESGHASDVDHVKFLSDREYEQMLAQRILTYIRTEFEETTWRACWMSVVEEQQASKIATELGISLNAVYLAKSRVLRRIRADLDDLLS